MKRVVFHVRVLLLERRRLTDRVGNGKCYQPIKSMLNLDRDIFL